jgi:hypothetical protein
MMLTFLADAYSLAEMAAELAFVQLPSFPASC